MSSHIHINQYAWLDSLGVRLICGYGATEVGAPSELHGYDRQNLDDWAYIKFSESADVRFVPQHDEDNTHELVFVVSESNRFILLEAHAYLKTTETHVPFIVNSEIEGRPAYRTKDLLVPHPSKPELWKMYAYIQVICHRTKANCFLGRSLA